MFDAIDSRDLPSPADLHLDLVVAVLYAIGTVVAVRFDVVPPAIRLVLGVLLLLFFSGYAVLALVFPAPNRGWTDGMPLVERLVLSVGLSLVIVPVLALLVTYSRFPLTPDTVLVAVAAFTTGIAVLAVVNRRRLQLASRPSGRDSPGIVATLAATADSRADAVLSMILVASIVFSVVAVGYAATREPGAEPFTTFTVVTQNESGEFVASEYPTTVETNQEETLYLVVENQEGHAVGYTMVVTQQLMNGSTEIGESREVNRTRIRVPVDDAQIVSYAFTPQTGADLRLAFLLYKGDPPPEPSPATAYRSLSIRVTTTSPAETVSDYRSSTIATERPPVTAS